MDWVSRIINLANFFTDKEEFSHARNHLAAASKVLEFTETEIYDNDNPAPDRCLEVEESAANVGKAWVIYGLSLLAYSVHPSAFANEGSDGETADEATNQGSIENQEGTKIQEVTEEAIEKQVDELGDQVEKGEEDGNENLPKEAGLVEEVEKKEVDKGDKDDKKEVAPKGEGDESHEVEREEKIDSDVKDNVLPEDNMKEATEQVDDVGKKPEEVEETSAVEDAKMQEAVSENVGDAEIQEGKESKKEDIPADEAKDVKDKEMKEEDIPADEAKDVKDKEIKKEDIPADETKEVKDDVDDEGIKPEVKDDGKKAEQELEDFAHLLQPSEEIDIDEYLKAIKTNPYFLFPTLDISAYLHHVPCSDDLTPETALFLYHFMRRWHVRRVMWDSALRHAGRYLTCVMEMNEAARCTGMLQPSLDNQYKTLMDRVRLLEVACQELNEDAPEFYADIKADLYKELADIQLEMMSVNLKRIVEVRDGEEVEE